MSRILLVSWTLLAAVVMFSIGVWVMLVPYGSLWVGLAFILIAGGLAAGIGLYLHEATPRRVIVPAPLPTRTRQVARSPVRARSAPAGPCEAGPTCSPDAPDSRAGASAGEVTRVSVRHRRRRERTEAAAANP